MTKMLDYIGDMQARLNEVARTEQTLIRALGDALAPVDQELLADVRDLTMAHEARRVAILEELQSLASRIGAFPAPATQPPALEARPQEVAAGPPVDQPSDVQEARAGDWRKAVSNIRDELDGYFGRSIQH